MGAEEVNRVEREIRELASLAKDLTGRRKFQTRMIQSQADQALHSLKELAKCLSPQE